MTRQQRARQVVGVGLSLGPALTTFAFCHLFVSLDHTILLPTAMLFRSAARTSRIASSSLSTLSQRRLASSLVFLEQKGGKLNDGSLTAVTAAQQVGGDVSGLGYPSLQSMQY